MAGSFPWQHCATVQPSSLAKHPETWTKEEVGAWLHWCSEEYSIELVPQHKFDLNGKALALLSRNDFMERSPKNGDVLFNSLNYLASKLAVERSQDSVNSSTVPDRYPQSTEENDSIPGSISDQSSARYHFMQSSNSSTSVAKVPSNVPYIPRSLSYLPIQSLPYVSYHTQYGDGHELMSLYGRTNSQVGNSPFIRPSSAPDTLRSESTDTDVSRQGRASDCRLLWKFIYQLLRDSKNSDIVCWEHKDRYVFRIVNPTGLADLWGQQKNRTNMTYEKLSRALRYYYRMNIIKKVPGERLTYRFLQPPKSILKGQRGSKYHYKGHMVTGSNSRVGARILGTETASFSGNSSSETMTYGGMRAAEMMFDKTDDHSKDSSEFEDDNISHNNARDLSSIKCPTDADNEQNVHSLQSYSSRLPFAHSAFIAHNERVERTDFQSLASCFPDFQHSGRGLQSFNSMMLPSSSSYQGSGCSSSFMQRRNSLPSSERDKNITDKTSKPKTIKSTSDYFSKNIRSSTQALRSSSLDFAITFPAQSSCSLRPSISSSPEVNLQLEPEDLSIKDSSESKPVPFSENLQEIEQLRDNIFSSGNMTTKDSEN